VQALEQVDGGAVAVGAQQQRLLRPALRVVAGRGEHGELGGSRQRPVLLVADLADVRGRLAVVVQPVLLLQAQERRRALLQLGQPLRRHLLAGLVGEVRRRHERRLPPRRRGTVGDAPRAYRSPLAKCASGLTYGPT